MPTTQAARTPRPVITERFRPYEMREIAKALAHADDAARRMLLKGGPFNQDDLEGIEETAAGLGDRIFGESKHSEHDDHTSVEQYNDGVFSAYLLGLSMGAMTGALIPSLVAVSTAVAKKGGR